MISMNSSAISLAPLRVTSAFSISEKTSLPPSRKP